MVIYSIAAGGTISIAHLFMGGIIPALMLGLSLDHPRFDHRAPQQLPEGRGRPVASGRQDRSRRGLGHDHGGDHHRRHSVGVFTPTESGAIACVYAFS
jgi:hypothetical protein